MVPWSWMLLTADHLQHSSSFRAADAPLSPGMTAFDFT
jgi:hypothetical protein